MWWKAQTRGLSAHEWWAPSHPTETGTEPGPSGLGEALLLGLLLVYTYMKSLLSTHDMRQTQTIVSPARTWVQLQHYQDTLASKIFASQVKEVVHESVCRAVENL